MKKFELNADTPLSALFRQEYHGMLRGIIESWLPAMVDAPHDDVLNLSTFTFDFDKIRPAEIYLDLVKLILHDALWPTMLQLANYMSTHSNLSRSESTLYGLLKKYKRMCE